MVIIGKKLGLMLRNRRHLSHVLGATLAGVSAVLVLAVVFVPQLPAAPPDVQRTGSPRGSKGLLQPPPSSLGNLTLDGLKRDIAASGKRRRAAVDRLLAAERADAPRLHTWLHRKTSLSPVDYKNLLRHIGAQVPDRYGRFSAPAPEKEVDWLKALLALDPRRLSRSLRPALVDTVLDVALMRGLAASKHPDAAVSLLRFAYRHNSAFKDECGRQIRAMRVHAVPGLLRARALRDPLAYKMVRYAAYQLDRIDCVRADRALKQADPELRVEILHAYGEVRDPGAVRAVLSYTNAADARVRRAARWSMLRYVSGRPPEAIKRKLKLPGGRETDRARALYMTYRQLASHAITDQLARSLSQSGAGSVDELRRRLDAESEPRHLAERLFTWMDRQRERAREQALAAALQQARSGQLAPAIREFDRQLALDPYHPRRSELAIFYYQRGCRLEDAGKARDALVALTKSILLAPRADFVADARKRRQRTEQEIAARSGGARTPSAVSQSDGNMWIPAVIGSCLVLVLTLGLGVVRRRLPV